jgi:hypothetical protein
LRTFSEAHPLEPAWQEQLNTALIAAVWAELTHRSSADDDAEADARVAHAAAAKARRPRGAALRAAAGARPRSPEGGPLAPSPQAASPDGDAGSDPGAVL